MNLRDLEYLVALADLGHFGRAAQSCNVSQPTLSTQIRKLEESLGVQLLERTSRKVVLTTTGREVVAQARRIMAEVEKLKDSARASQGVLSGTLRLGVFPTLGPYFLPLLMPLLATHTPNLKPYLIEEKTSNLIAGLRDGRLDAAFLAGPVIEDDLREVDLFSEPFVAALPREHELAKNKTIDIHRLEGEKLLLLEEGHCFREQALEVCQQAGATENEFKATSLETLRHMVAAGLGVTLLPALSVQHNQADIAVRPFKTPVPERSIALVWRRGSPLTASLQALADVLKDNIRHPELRILHNG